MVRAIVILTAMVLAAGSAYAYEKGTHAGKNGNVYTVLGGKTKCAAFLEEYVRANVRRTRDGSYVYSIVDGSEIKLILGFINGYGTRINQAFPGKENWYAPLDMAGMISWIASWCRDNPGGFLSEAMKALTKSVLKKKK